MTTENVRRLEPTRKGFNYDFRLFLEGVQVPFMSAQISCTPNGVDASINLPYHHSIYGLKPKTAVQIFYREWFGNGEWKIMFDGFFSRYDSEFDVNARRGVSITCRDFRMDIRKTPAAIVLENERDSLATQTYYNEQGLFQTSTLPGINGGETLQPRTYSLGVAGLNPAQHIIEYIAGFAAGRQVAPKNNGVDGELKYSGIKSQKWSIGGLDKQYNADGKLGENRTASEMSGDGAFFLDAFARGIWIEAVGSVNIASFLNKRIRADKRMMIAPNLAGYNIFAHENFGLLTGGILLGNSMFSSIEAIIMRVAGLFMSHVFSCNTPSIIDLNNGSKSNTKVMHESVRNFLVNRENAEFGQKYILNETMLLPPMHFTAPPNCNIFLPPMYDSYRFQYDHDVDITRGYYRISDSLASAQGNILSAGTRQFPSALFSKELNESDKSGKSRNRKTPPITIEERYKGMNIIQGSLDSTLATKDSQNDIISTYFNLRKANELKERIDKLSTSIDKTSAEPYNGDLFKSELIKMNVPESRVDEIIKAIEQKKLDKKIAKYGSERKKPTVESAYSKHMIIKFMNTKFAGRVANVDMAFNPFPMCGFPGLIVTDSDERMQSSNPLIGFVQQIKHFIVVTSDGGEASTSVAMNNVRYIDESTDMNKFGLQLYMPATDREKALLNDELEYASPSGHHPPAGSPIDEFDDDSDSPYDVDELKEIGLLYARDFVTLSEEAVRSGQLTSTYLDLDYAPNHITRYYRDVFRQKHHLMVGETTYLGSPAKFMYDTIHEAVSDIVKTRPELLTRYEDCLEYIQRNICSADEFYQAILGLSIRTEGTDTQGKKTLKYVVNNTFDKTRLEREYWGITNEVYDSLVAGKDKRVDLGGTIRGIGDFSSIRETHPLTAFTRERKDAVKEYLTQINRLDFSMNFADERLNSNGSK